MKIKHKGTTSTRLLLKYLMFNSFLSQLIKHLNY